MPTLQAVRALRVSLTYRTQREVPANRTGSEHARRVELGVAYFREARLEAGYLLRQLQQGRKIGMPHSRRMPSIAKNVHELRELGLAELLREERERQHLTEATLAERPRIQPVSDRQAGGRRHLGFPGLGISPRDLGRRITGLKRPRGSSDKAG